MLFYSHSVSRICRQILAGRLTHFMRRLSNYQISLFFLPATLSMGAPSRSFVGKENKRPGALEKRRILFPGKEGKRCATGVHQNIHDRRATRRLTPPGGGAKDASSQWPIPLKPMNASDISPAMTKAMGVPAMALGRRQVSSRSRIPAMSSRASVKPTL